MNSGDSMNDLIDNLNNSRAGGKTLLYGIPNSTRFYSRPNYNTPFLAGLVFLLLSCPVRCGNLGVL